MLVSYERQHTDWIPLTLSLLKRAMPFAFIAVLVGLGYITKLEVAKSDPDRYYHLRLSQISADEGLQSTLPQAEDLGWGDKFPDKEFLFHILTSATHFVGGEKLLSHLPFFLQFLIFVCLFLACRRFLSTKEALLLILFAIAGNYWFSLRMSMLRPHVLAILVFCLLLYACMFSRSRYVAPLLCFLYALAYHAIYVPLVGIGCFALVHFWNRDFSWLKTLAYAVLALIAGTILSPYFLSLIHI